MECGTNGAIGLASGDDLRSRSASNAARWSGLVLPLGNPKTTKGETINVRKREAGGFCDASKQSTISGHRGEGSWTKVEPPPHFEHDHVAGSEIHSWYAVPEVIHC